MIGSHVFQRRRLLQSLHKSIGPEIELIYVRILQCVLVLRAAYPVIDGDVLHRLHVQLDAIDLGQAGVKAANHVGGAEIALVERLEIDRHAAAVQGGVGAIGANEGGEAFHRRILQDHLGQILLGFGHGGKGDGGWRLRDPLDYAGVLYREKPFRNDDVEVNRKDQCAQRNQQGECLEA